MAPIGELHDKRRDMPSIEACSNSKQENVTSVSSTIELFDRYKSDKNNDEVSDSEESFHLPLHDETEYLSNGDDKLENVPDKNPNSDKIPDANDTISDKEQTKESDIIKSDEITSNDLDKLNSEQNVNETISNSDEQKLVTVSELPTKSTESETDKPVEEKENTDQENAESKKSDVDPINETELETKEPNNDQEITSTLNDVTILPENNKTIPESETVTDKDKNINQLDQNKEANDKILALPDDCIKSKEIENSTEINEPNKKDEIKEIKEIDTEKHNKDEMHEDTIFDEKSNEMDLLNISMVRGTEEDDLTDDETELSDKTSDDEHQDDHNIAHTAIEHESDNEHFEADEHQPNEVQQSIDSISNIPMEIDHDFTPSNEIISEKNDLSVSLPSIDATTDDVGKSTDIGNHSVPPKFENHAESNDSLPNKILQSPPVLECFKEIPNEVTKSNVCDKVLDDQNLLEQDVKKTKDESEPQRGKRTFSQTNLEDNENVSKKIKTILDDRLNASANKQLLEEKKENVKDLKLSTLFSFSEYMKLHGLGSKLTRADLEQLCLQKICESLTLKSIEGEQNQQIKKLEKIIDGLKKDISQLLKQAKDLEIVNRNLMYEIKNNVGQKRPLVPIKITRSVGLQVRFNPNGDIMNNAKKRVPPSLLKQPNTVTTATTSTIATVTTTTSTNNVAVGASPISNPKTTATLIAPRPTPGTAVNNKIAISKTVSNQINSNKRLRRSIAQKSPATPKSTTASPKPSSKTVVNSNLVPQKASPANNNKRASASQQIQTPTTSLYKANESSKSKTASVIDLTDEDDRLIKIVQKSPAKTVNGAQMVPIAKVIQAKTIPVNQKAVAVQGANTSTNSRTAIPSGLRLAGSSVIASTPNGPQLLYVVPTINSNITGGQKVTFVNGVLSGNLNGSPVSVVTSRSTQPLTIKPTQSLVRPKHPAALPIIHRSTPDPKLKPLLPKPILTIKKIDTGIILQWKMPYNLEQYETIASYQLYAYQETSAPPSTDMWRKVGDVKALALPMACTLTQFADKNKYYFAVRSVDIHKRIGAFSDPESISL